MKNQKKKAHVKCLLGRSTQKVAAAIIKTQGKTRGNSAGNQGLFCEERN
jgi:hypothetical protein